MPFMHQVRMTVCCNLCRIGPREKYFHCEKCNLCLGQDLRGNHKVANTLSLILILTHLVFDLSVL